MVEEDLAKMDFSRDWDIVKDCSEKLKENGINHWLICEVTDAEGFYSKYHSSQWAEMPEGGKPGETATGVNEEILKNHLGGLVTCVLDVFTYQFLQGVGRKPTSEEIWNMMLTYHGVYFNNVQPK